MKLVEAEQHVRANHYFWSLKISAEALRVKNLQAYDS